MVSAGNLLSAEEKLSRKRMAARLRQQRCRARKRKMIIEMQMKKAAAQATTPLSPGPDENVPLLPHTSALCTPRVQHTQPFTITPPSGQGLVGKHSLACPSSAFFTPGSHSYRQKCAPMPMTYPRPLPSVTPSGSNRERSGFVPRPRVQFALSEHRQSPRLGHPSLRFEGHVTPPVKRFFIQRANQQAKENEQVTGNRQFSSQEIRQAPLFPRISFRPIAHHRRSSSEVAKIEAVDAILSLKTSQPDSQSALESTTDSVPEPSSVLELPRNEVSAQLSGLPPPKMFDGPQLHLSQPAVVVTRTSSMDSKEEDRALSPSWEDRSLSPQCYCHDQRSMAMPMGPVPPHAPGFYLYVRPRPSPVDTGLNEISLRDPQQMIRCHRI